MSETIPTPPPFRSVNINTGGRSLTPAKSKGSWLGAIAVVFFFAVIGVGSGYLAGNYFPLWGGINLMGEPGSPAHDAVVRSHIVACGLVGFAIGFATIVITKLAK